LRRTPLDLEAAARDALELCAIPAPTFAEAERGQEMARRLAAAGLEPRQDGVGNVVARLGGDGAAVVVAAHLDTVFPATTVLAPTRDGDVLRGPGIGDNALALAALLAIARDLAAAPEPSVPVLLAATVGEEGLGDLRGVRALLDETDTTCLVALEGHGIDSLTVGGVASARIAARYTGPGGHSWSDRGRPSAVHALVAAASAALAVAAPAHANVGVLHGGIAVNAIAPDARLELDLRHDDDAVVDGATARASAALATVPAGIEATVEVVGRRPGGRLDADHPLLAAARTARERAGLAVAMEEMASTDANAALGRGIPAVALGISRGGGTHREDEWIELAPAAQGIDAARLLVRALARGLP
jgi:tripeptide aminopeptidase